MRIETQVAVTLALRYGGVRIADVEADAEVEYFTDTGEANLICLVFEGERDGKRQFVRVFEPKVRDDSAMAQLWADAEKQLQSEIRHDLAAAEMPA